MTRESRETPARAGSRAISIIGAVLFALAASAPRAAQGGDWEQLEAHLEYRKLEHTPGEHPRPVTIHAFRFAPDHFELRVRPAPDGERGAEVRTLAEDNEAIMAVNGSFFGTDRAPMGLVVSEGRETSPLRRVNWGVFFVADGRAGVVHSRDWQPPPALEFAIQAGPRLVVDGKSPSFKPQQARRTALGVTTSGQIVIVATEGALLTSDFAALLRRPESEGGLGCRDALNLDGGSSTQLWFKQGARRIEIPARRLVANAVLLLKRQTDAD